MYILQADVKVGYLMRLSQTLLRYVKDWVQSIYIIRRVRGNNYVVCGES